jgi:hypothetical protein
VLAALEAAAEEEWSDDDELAELGGCMAGRMDLQGAAVQAQQQKSSALMPVNALSRCCGCACF